MNVRKIVVQFKDGKQETYYTYRMEFAKGVLSLALSPEGWEDGLYFPLTEIHCYRITAVKAGSENMRTWRCNNAECRKGTWTSSSRTCPDCGKDGVLER